MILWGMSQNRYKQQSGACAYEKSDNRVPDYVWTLAMGNPSCEPESWEGKQCNVCGTGTGILLWRACNSSG